jgi:AcrR family transcriptional regulator
VSATSRPAPVRRRNGRTERTRRALTEAALSLFVEQGYDATTVDQIAAAAGVGQRTFFHHFATKEAVLFGGYEERLREVTAGFRDAARDGTLWDGLYGATISLVNAIETQRDLFLVRGRLYRETPNLRATMLRVNEDWIDNITQIVAERLRLDPETNVGPRLAATVANGANRVAIDLWTASSGQLDLATLAQQAFVTIRPTIDEIERAAGAVR